MFSLYVFPLLLSREIVVGRKIWSALIPLPPKFPPTLFFLFLKFPSISFVLGSQKKSLGSLRHLQSVRYGSYKNSPSLLVPKMLWFQT